MLKQTIYFKKNFIKGASYDKKNCGTYTQRNSSQPLQKGNGVFSDNFNARKCGGVLCFMKELWSRKTDAI